MAAESHSGEAEQRYTQFQRLRDEVWEMTLSNFEEIVKTRPPTEFELSWKQRGVPLPLLEPQVRDAVIAFNEKGYPTFQSGFEGRDHPDIQFMEGPFTLDEETKLKLAVIGVRVTSKKRETRVYAQEYGDFTVLLFRPEAPDLDQMKATWDTIAAMLPNRNPDSPSSYSRE